VPAKSPGGAPNFSLLLNPRRIVYSPAQKAAILSALRASGGDQAAVLRAVRRVSGFEKVQRSHLIRWLAADSAAPRRVGRPVNAPFERAVLGRLLCVEPAAGAPVGAPVRVLANIAHSYEIIQMAAADAQRSPPWAGDASVRRLAFSHKWVRGFLDRATLRRRRNTSSDKPAQAPGVVRARMAEIQAVISAGPVGGQPPGQPPGFAPDDVVNADETASRYARPSGAARSRPSTRG
jgi:hypothetical protein